ncbi:hypothetical protein FRB91_001951 [Serendipita sp. 411]|nr:hypothetical protein FRB91_001951 [Serendipita sp. 411]
MERDKNDLADTDVEDGNDDSRRAETTARSGSFIGFGVSLSEPKSSYQPNGFTNVAAPPSTIPSPPNPNNHLYENLQPIPQQRENYRRRSTRHDHRPQPSLSSYVTAYNMDAPPPAYSDVSNIFERTGGRQYQENEENLSEEDDVGEAPERIR